MNIPQRSLTMDSLLERIKDIEKNILNDVAFKTLTMNSNTIPYLSIRVEEIIRQTVIRSQDQQTQEPRQGLQSIPREGNADTLIRQQLTSTEGELQQCKDELANVSQLYLEALNKNTEYLERISHFRSQVELLHKIEQRANDQYQVIAEKEEHILEVSTKLHQQILVGEALRREKDLLEAQLDMSKQKAQRYQESSDKEKSFRQEFQLLKEECNRVRKELTTKSQEMHQAELELIQLQSKNRHLRQDIEALVIERQNGPRLDFLNEKDSSPSKPRQIKKQKRQSSQRKKNIGQEKDSEDRTGQLYNKIFNLQELNHRVNLQKQALIGRLRRIGSETILLRAVLAAFKSQIQHKLSGVIQLTANKAASMVQLFEILQTRCQAKITLLRLSHQGELSSVKSGLTQQLLSNKKELRHYVKQLGHKQNMFHQAQEELLQQRKFSISTKAEASTKLIRDLETKLYFKCQIQDLKTDHSKFKQLSSIKSRVKGKETRERGGTGDPETTKKKSKGSGQ